MAHTLLENNRRWASALAARQPDFFARLAAQQSPGYFWIGCSDSRVPANQIVDLLPGELFVHRNVANVVVHTDLNCLSALEYAVDALGVSEVIVCGHYGCGGVRAALERTKIGLIDNWLRHVQDVHLKHSPRVEPLATHEERLSRLCELNVIEQARHVCETTIVHDAWARGRPVAVHAWIYSLADGLLHDLGFSPSAASEVSARYAQALGRLPVSG